MELPEELRCLYAAEIETQDGDYVFPVPDRQLELGAVTTNEAYRIAVMPAVADEESAGSEADQAQSGPPVEEGEIREVEIETLGDQGDGLARVGPGYVVIVPETQPGEQVTVEITDVRPNFAFADVVE